jgi:hypothetical protein
MQDRRLVAIWMLSTNGMISTTTGNTPEITTAVKEEEERQ